MTISRKMGHEGSASNSHSTLGSVCGTEHYSDNHRILSVSKAKKITQQIAILEHLAIF